MCVCMYVCMYQRTEEAFCSKAIYHINPWCVETLIIGLVILLGERKPSYNNCSWNDDSLLGVGLSLDNNHEILESCIRVVQVLATIIHGCTNVPLRSFYLPTFHSKKSHGDRSVPTYTNLTRGKDSIIPHRGSRSLILILLYPPVTGINPSGDSCVWAALFRTPLLTQTKGLW